MTRAEIIARWESLTPEQRDEWVAEAALGWRRQRTSCMCGGKEAWLKPRDGGAHEMAGCVCHHTPPLTTAWDGAGRVFAEMTGRLFSQRRRFYRELQRRTTDQELGVMAAWPDVLTVLASHIPESFALAALLTTAED